MRWRFGLGLLVVALSAAFFAVAFRWSLSAVLRHAAGVGDVVSAMRRAPMWARLLLSAVGGLLAGTLGLVVARSSTGAGVGDVMEAVVLGRVHLKMRSTLLKSAASWLAIVFGGSIGREGPLIQFGGAAGKLASDRRCLRAAVLFVLEVVTGMVMLDVILPALVAMVIAATVLRGIIGDGPIYGQRTLHLQSSVELLAFAGLGFCAALGAQGFMRLLAFGERMFKRPWLSLPWRSGVGGLLAGCVLVALPEAAGNGYESVECRPRRPLQHRNGSAPIDERRLTPRRLRSRKRALSTVRTLSARAGSHPQNRHGELFLCHSPSSSHSQCWPSSRSGG